MSTTLSTCFSPTTTSSVAILGLSQRFDLTRSSRGVLPWSGHHSHQQSGPMSASRSPPHDNDEKDDTRRQRARPSRGDKSRAARSPRARAPPSSSSRSRSPAKHRSSAGWATSTRRDEGPSRASAAAITKPAADELDKASNASGDSSDDDGDESDELAEENEVLARVLSASATPGPATSVSQKDLVYVLEVIQQPQRARACGFGDKDRRPLSPPPIIQLRIFDKLGKLVSPQSIDFHRFVLMADLWNGERTQQRSIVMHPGARPDQFALYTQTASRVPSSHRYDTHQSTFGRMPPRSSPTPAHYGWQGSEWQHERAPSYTHSSSPSHPYQSLPPYGSHSQHAAAPGSSGPWLQPPTESPMTNVSPRYRGYRLSPEEYDPRPPSTSRISDMGPPSVTRDSRGWTPESTSVATDYGLDRPGTSYASAFRPSTSTAESTWKEPAYQETRPHTTGFSEWDRMHASSARPWSSTGEPGRLRSSNTPLFTHAPSPIHQQSQLPLTASPGSVSTLLYTEGSQGDRMSTASHYSRVLVGSMGAVCQRLKGLDGEQGLFFFAHNLGIRTEGTFSLRFTLTDLSPLAGPDVQKDDSTRTLATIFSEPFTVYSAKRFPGVLPTTDLTQCFADQSVRLPTRQRRSNSEAPAVKRKK